MDNFKYTNIDTIDKQQQHLQLQQQQQQQNKQK